ncbi:hypothetical protein BgAZ_201350 [Babesia gibsoni]|uniref:Uncharacterized protein n=1 Tax=Babesia gibsoni TaxID=33632 RepID=A0AAD8LLW9_BABGI|nr:hypothetical protein BgAZ_201350 [Babesia gibsoni]
MEVRVICSCAECSSRLIEVGGVNILCNLPSKLLREHDKEDKVSYTCHEASECNDELYRKLLCLRIHVIIATSARYLRDIDILKKYIDLSTTHVVCTRPVYTIAATLIPTNDRYPAVEVMHTACIKGKEMHHARIKGGKRGGNRQSYDTTGDDDAMSNDGNLHGSEDSAQQQQSYGDGSVNGPGNEPPATHKDCQEAADSQKETDAMDQTEVPSRPNASLDWLMTRSNYLKNKPFFERLERGDRFGRHSNKAKKDELPYLKDPDVPYSRYFHATSYNETVTLEIEDAGKHYVDKEMCSASETHLLLGKSEMRFLSTIELSAYSSGFSLGSSNWLVKHVDSNASIALVGETGELNHERYCTPVDTNITGKADLIVLLDNTSFCASSDVEVKVKSPSKRSQTKVDTPHVDEKLNLLCNKAMEGMQNPEGVVIVTDPYAETLFDVLEHMQAHISHNIKAYQNVYIYAFGEGFLDLFNYADKCAEWVSASRAERTMHHENPSSPFSVISQMREENRLFLGNSTEDIKHVYRYPSIVIVPYDVSVMPFLNGKLYSGASLVTTRRDYAEELTATAKDMGVEADVQVVELDFRGHFRQLITWLGKKLQFVTSPKVKEMMPKDYKVLSGDVITLPLGMVDGLLKASVKSSQLKGLFTNAKTFPDGATATVLDVKLSDAESLEFFKSSLEADHGKFTFGTFTVDQILQKLLDLGIEEFRVLEDKQDYPIKIVGSEKTTIILESPNETCIETSSEATRTKIMGILEELLVAL